VSDTHQLLDAYAAEDPFDGDHGRFSRRMAAPEAIAALRTILGLHRPHDSFCDACAGIYPCDTVQVIQTALEAS
jgi:hypothetical protein